MEGLPSGNCGVFSGPAKSMPVEIGATVANRGKELRQMRTGWLLIGIVGAIFVTLGGRLSAQATLPDGPNRDLVAGVCGSCHDIEMVVINGRSEANWRGTIDEMAGYGMRLSPAESAMILEYLTTYLPPK
jgi:hypothetical protein